MFVKKSMPSYIKKRRELLFAYLCKFLNKTNGQMDVQKSTVSYIEKQTKYHIVYSMFFFINKNSYFVCWVRVQ